ncbi:hypothetical protein ACRWQM_07680 [Shewanella sp. HL-SH5]
MSTLSTLVLLFPLCKLTVPVVLPTCAVPPPLPSNDMEKFFSPFETEVNL